MTEHEHVWEFAYSYDDWYDGDSEDTYKCTIEGCWETQIVYHPR